MYDNDKSIISFRHVVNDAVVGPWQPMPEITPTFKGLVRYLIENKFDLNHISVGTAFCGNLVDYGLRQQFYVPRITKQDVKCLDSYLNPSLFVKVNNTPLCPYCMDELRISKLILHQTPKISLRFQKVIESPEEYDLGDLPIKKAFDFECPTCGKTWKEKEID